MTIFILTIMFGALIATAVGLVWSIGSNMRRGSRVRIEMAARLEQLPLAQLLRKHSIDPLSYLNERPLVEVERQIRNCAGCESTEACEDTLAQQADPAGHDFCANGRDIDALSPVPAGA